MTTTTISDQQRDRHSRITNHTAGLNGHLPLCFGIEPPIAVMIGEAHANAITPPISARSGDQPQTEQAVHAKREHKHGQRNADDDDRDCQSAHRTTGRLMMLWISQSCGRPECSRATSARSGITRCPKASNCS